MTRQAPPLTAHGEPRCPYVAASKWGPVRCVLPEGHWPPNEHAYGGDEWCKCSPAEVEDGFCVLCGNPFRAGGAV